MSVLNAHHVTNN